MDEKVEPSPGLFDLLENRVHAGVVRDVTGHDQVGANRLSQRLNTLQERLALIGEGELGAMRASLRGDSPGDRSVVGDPHDQAFASGQQR